MERLPISRPIALRTSHGLISPRGRRRLDRLWRNGGAKLFSPGSPKKREGAAIPRGKTKKFRAAVLRFASGRSTAPAIARDLTIAIEAATGAGS